MSAKEKAELYGLYKQVATPEKHYRNYSADELRTLLTDLGVDIDEALSVTTEAPQPYEPMPELRLPDPNGMPS